MEDGDGFRRSFLIAVKYFSSYERSGGKIQSNFLGVHYSEQSEPSRTSIKGAILVRLGGIPFLDYLLFSIFDRKRDFFRWIINTLTNF